MKIYGNTNVPSILGLRTQKYIIDTTYTAKYTGNILIALVGGGGGAGSYSYSRYGGGGSGVVLAKVWLTKGEEVQISIGQGGAGVSGQNNAPDGGTTTFGNYAYALGGQGAIGFTLTLGRHYGGNAGRGNTNILPTNLLLPPRYHSKLSIFDLEESVSLEYPAPTNKYQGGIGFGGPNGYGTGGTSAYGTGAAGRNGVCYVLEASTGEENV